MTPPPFTTSSCTLLPGYSLAHRTAASIIVGRGASQGGALTHFRTPTGCRGPFGCSTVHRAPRRRPVQGTAARGGFATNRDLGRFPFRSACHEENLAQFNFYWNCGVQPVRVLPAPRYPQRSPVVVDVQKLQARRRNVLAAMEGRPGRVRKSRVADEFDASSSFWPDPVVGRQQRGMMSSIFPATLTLREKAPRWCMRRLAQA